ncbi:hypothetical protein LRP31_22540 [Mesorhizobium mediterraneum]|nr:hypothetical protein [Mesorhizobium mediterraneum]RWN31823.1 MAG: hypothetical protein EOR96_29780 [Mesorhizobium sp.]TIU15769.1 MAG: hypothetical protein E5W40_02145 [Mesorhizobium sp.]WIW51830.1 hypothetical protein LRP31_22540 [Mesorhizobium mediterraneum]
MDKIIKERDEKRAKAGVKYKGDEIVVLESLKAVLNGCMSYRGPRTKPVCKNMTPKECHTVDLKLKEKDINFFAKMLDSPCEK